MGVSLRRLSFRRHVFDVWAKVCTIVRILSTIRHRIDGDGVQFTQIVKIL